MTRRIAQFIFISLALAGVCAAQSYPNASGWCEQGNGIINVNGNPNTPSFKVMKSFPQCTVTVFLPGTTTKAALFSNTTGTSLGNPFTATTTGFWQFYAAGGSYDVQFSGTGISAPFTTRRVSLGVIISVTGAVADGTGSAGTDQRAVFQAALDAANTAGGGAVFIPYAPLCYTIGFPGIKVYSNVTVYSDSQATCLQAKPGAMGASGWAIFSNNDAVTGLANVHIRNLTLDMNRANITGLSSSVLGPFGVALYGASNSSVESSIIKNGGDGVYLDCAGSGRLTAGSGVTVSHVVSTNNMRNNVTLVCGTNVSIEDSELSYANGASPEAGIDVEENAVGQVVTGFSISRTRVHHNNKQGILIIPAHDAAGTLGIRVTDNDVHDNGFYGLYASDFTHVNSIVVVGGSYKDNANAQMLFQGWVSGVAAGVLADGGSTGTVGAAIASSAHMAFSGGFYSGTSSDLNSDSFSTNVVSGVKLGHGTVSGVQYFVGSFGPDVNVSGTDFGVTHSYLNVGAGFSVPNGNNFWCHNAVLGAGAALTAQRCMFWDNLLGGTFNIGAQGAIMAGTGNFNLNMTGTARNFFASGFQTTPKNLSAYTADFPCNSTNYGMTFLINDAVSTTFNSAITGGGGNTGLAVCDPASGVYRFH